MKIKLEITSVFRGYTVMFDLSKLEENKKNPKINFSTKSHVLGDGLFIIIFIKTYTVEKVDILIYIRQARYSYIQ